MTATLHVVEPNLEQYYAVSGRGEGGWRKPQMRTNDQEVNDEMRPEYVLSELEGGVRGKYAQQYHEKASAPRVRADFLIAIVCGALPLVSGSAIYWTWRAARWPWLETAGMINILVGTLLFVIGAVALVHYLNAELHNRRTKRNAIILRGALVGGLLLINYPAAAIYGLSAGRLMERYTVVIENDTGSVIDSILLQAPGVRMEAGPIAAGGRITRHMHFGSDGALTFTAQQQDLRFSGEIEGYVTGGIGGWTILRIQPNGMFELQRRARVRLDD